ANVGARSMFSRTELGLGVRAMLADAEPFSAGAFTDIWWGATVFDNRQRNGFTFNLGVVASLTAVTHVTISGRAWLNVWDDRHCPDKGADPTMNDGFAADSQPLEVCKDWHDGVLTQSEQLRIHNLTGWQIGNKDAVFDRESGHRG